MNDRFIRALLRETVDRTPVWMMRQAGRYLPEYRKLRAEVPNFLQFCKTPELASEVTLQPLRRFDLDAAIIFSDILVIPDAMGLSLQFVQGEGPEFLDPIRTEHDLTRLQPVDVEKQLGYVLEAIRRVKKELTVPLIGFAGSPWTVATYMIEGGSSKTFTYIKTMMFQNPDLLHQLKKQLADLTADYLK